MNATELFTTAGHMSYVWGVYAIASVVLLFNVIQPIRRRREVFKRLRKYHRLKNNNR